MQRCTITKTVCKFWYVLACASAFFSLTGAPQLWGASSQKSDPSGVLTLHAYEAELAKYSAQLDKIKGKPAEISRLRNSLPSYWTVDAGGAECVVSTDWLVSALADLQVHPKNADSTLRNIQFRLGAMRESARDLEKPATGFPEEEARSHLDRILQRREFAGVTGPGTFQLLEERVTRWLLGLIERLLKRLHISAKTGNRLAWIFISLAFLAIVYWAFRALSERSRSIEMPSAEPAPPGDSRLWVHDALAAAERGEYREAIRCAYWAAIARLEDMRLLTCDRSRTPRESLRLLKALPAEQNSLGDLTTRFELVWYGYRMASAADWTGAKAQLERFGCLKASIQPTVNS